MDAQLILASASPRRKELLEQLKLKILIRPVDLNETPHPGEQPRAYVERLAAEKSQLCRTLYPTILPVLAADTAVVLDDEIMGKPKDKADAMAMLSRLSGRTHRVYTAVSLRGKAHWSCTSMTDVVFRKMNEAEMLAYWASGEPADKAGSYAIQGLGGLFVESIKGSYSGVVGLPVYETAQLLSKQGIDLLV